MDSDGFAQQLATELGVPVKAPTNYLWLNQAGKHQVNELGDEVKGAGVFGGKMLQSVENEERGGEWVPTPQFMKNGEPLMEVRPVFSKPGKWKTFYPRMRKHPDFSGEVFSEVHMYKSDVPGIWQYLAERWFSR